MKDKEIKSCPFCGGKAECKTHYVYGKSRGHFVYCTKCQITQDKLYTTRQYAIKKWNKRTEKTCKETAEKCWQIFLLLVVSKLDMCWKKLNDANRLDAIREVLHKLHIEYQDELAKQFGIEIEE